MAENLFGSNQKFKEAVQAINSIPTDKIPLILQRIIRKLHLKNEKPFTEAEEQQLQSAFSLSESQVQSALDGIAFIFEQAAYFGLNPQVLTSQLEKVGIVTQKLSAFETVWKQEAKELVIKLRGKSLAPFQLETVNWRLHLQVGQSNLFRLKEPSAVFEFGLTSTSETTKQANERLTMEFTHEELEDFFQRLETIQEQLDNLG